MLVAFSVSPVGTGEAVGAAVAASAPRVSLVLKADIRPGFTDMLTAKIASVERHLEV